MPRHLPPRAAQPELALDLRAHQRDYPAGLYDKTHLIEDLLFLFVRKRDLVELDLAFEFGGTFRSADVTDLVLGLQDFLDALVADRRLRIGIGHL